MSKLLVKLLTNIASKYLLKYSFDYIIAFAEALRDDITTDGYQSEDVGESAKIAFKKVFNL